MRDRMTATGKKHKTKQRKTSVPDVESRLVRKELDERRGLQPTGSTETHHKASTEAFFTPRRVVTDDGCTGSPSPNNNGKEYKGERLNAHKAHHRIRREILCKMMGFVRQVGAFCRENDRDSYSNRRRRHAASAGGRRRPVELIDMENNRKTASFRTDCISTDRGSNSLQDAVVFDHLSGFYAENNWFSYPPWATRSPCSRAERCTLEIRGALRSRNSQSASASTVASRGMIRTPLERA